MTVIVARIFCPRFSSTDESNERDVESHPRLYETKGKIFLFLRIEYDLFERKVFGMRAAYYFSSSHLRKAARSSFAESDFRCVSKRNGVPQRVLRRSAFARSNMDRLFPMLLFPSLFDTRFIQISIKLSRNAPCIALLYRCQIICWWQKRATQRATQRA